MSEQITSSSLTLAERMVQAGSEIIRLHTDLPLELCHHILDKSLRKAGPEFGVVPYQTDDVPIALRFSFVKRAFHYVAQDLANRGIESSAVGYVESDLDAFYRGVRGIPPADGN
jgi:hypothetical protein